MAKQIGLIKLKGTIGNVTFYSTVAGDLARQKGGVDAKRIATDPAFQRTRENGSEFGRAGMASRLLCATFRDLMAETSDSYMYGRLTGRFVKVIRADATNSRGLRNVIDGEAELLKGFEFNIRGRLKTKFFAPFTANIDRVTGAASVDIPAYIPKRKVLAPRGTTHYRINVAAAEVNFEEEAFVDGIVSSPELPLDRTLTAPLNMVIDLPPNSTKPLFLALGLEFFQEVNGEMFNLLNGAHNPTALVKVSGAA
ncbi:hypothetical protein [Chitinophaga barathri]|uniref:Uncharacterized protein n=1 Tax=Chitinophaga barathri TaxID=1647451 RepID=A0A3N4M7H2_9BACT|nr:hypothetical protein [Chitinophaga barathri]RPD39444.1 hypothetical protein EG028_20190 [Chitinophaga barathri]